jgi:hypothetical protein
MSASLEEQLSFTNAFSVDSSSSKQPSAIAEQVPQPVQASWSMTGLFAIVSPLLGFFCLVMHQDSYLVTFTSSGFFGQPQISGTCGF